MKSTNRSLVVDGGPNLGLGQLREDGVTMVLRTEVVRRLDHFCSEWVWQRYQHEGDGTFTISLARDLRDNFWKDFKLLVSLPEGPKQTVRLLLELGEHLIDYDDPLLVGATNDPGTPYYEEAKKFFLGLDASVNFPRYITDDQGFSDQTWDVARGDREEFSRQLRVGLAVMHPYRLSQYFFGSTLLLMRSAWHDLLD